MDKSMDIKLKRALSVVVAIDYGLAATAVLGQHTPGKLPVGAAICFALGEKGELPTNMSRSLFRLLSGLNDLPWSSNRVRAKGLIALALAAMDTADTLDELSFSEKLGQLVFNQLLPNVFRRAAPRFDRAINLRLLEAAIKCETAGIPASAKAAAVKKAATAAANYAAAMEVAVKDAARKAAAAKKAATAAADYAAAMEVAAKDAATAAAANYAAAMAVAAKDAARVAAEDAAAKGALAYETKAAADAVKVAARAAVNAAPKKKGAANIPYLTAMDVADTVRVVASLMHAGGNAKAADKLFSDFAEEVVTILVQMNTPGSTFLYLTQPAERRKWRRRMRWTIGCPDCAWTPQQLNRM